MKTDIYKAVVIYKGANGINNFYKNRKHTVLVKKYKPSLIDKFLKKAKNKVEVTKIAGKEGQTVIVGEKAFYLYSKYFEELKTSYNVF